MAAVAKYEVHDHDHNDVIKALFQVHPSVVLDQLFSGDERSRKEGIRLLNDAMRFDKNALDGVRDDVILDWCSRDPDIRYPIAAAGMTGFYETPRLICQRSSTPEYMEGRGVRELECLDHLQATV